MFVGHVGQQRWYSSRYRVLFLTIQQHHGGRYDAATDILTLPFQVPRLFFPKKGRAMECDNCGHDENEHFWDENLSRTVCVGEGRFDDGDPQCDCDMFEEEEEDQ